MQTIGFIGCRNMGGAIAAAVCKTAQPQSVLLANRTPEKAAALAAMLGCRTGSNQNAAACGWVFLAVKPQMMPDMLENVSGVLRRRAAAGERFVLVSMAAGLTMERIRTLAQGEYPVIRMMPNTPAAIGAGMIQYCCAGVTDEEKAEFCKLLCAAGRLDELSETLIDAASCVSGCGPAWAYQFIEALADGGVMDGVPRDKAQRFAAQAVLGSAAMVLETGKHPGELKDAVCSPAGSTIVGVETLERAGFRGAVASAVYNAYVKTTQLGK